KKILNLFGEQRFGTNNKEVGKAIIKKDFKKAVKLLKLSPKGNDFIGALRTIPKKILKLYIHSYQSHLWNKLAEEKRNSLENKKIQIIGFATKQTKEINDILKKEGITQRDFIIRQIPELSSEGAERDLFAEIQDLDVKKVDKGYILKFKLKKGSYATEVVKQIFS
ncbi:MAG: tRNA pseudouridine(13) synthase TruD, partial [Nanoarchaeota archaeon]|nr:tRNA pseudouridine(13) synthase TruD [Nanoarchaeota archaeon]